MVQISAILATLAACTSFVEAHPGQSMASKRAELWERNNYIRSLENTDLVHCAKSLTARGAVQKTVERREDMLKVLRRKRGLSETGKPIMKPQTLRFTAS
jgi:hypothetical protein